MKFARSVADPHYLEQDSHLICLAHSHAAVSPVAKDSPQCLKQRIIAGEDIFAIWFEHENEGVLREMQRHGFLGQSGTLLPSIDKMSVEDVLEFCQKIGVHPAHLVPFDCDLRLALPSPVLQALINIQLYEGTRSIYSREEIDLARVAIGFEAQRHQNTSDYLQQLPAEQRKACQGLSQIFADILSSPLLLQKMEEGELEITEDLPRLEGYHTYPLLERIEDLAKLQEDKLLREFAWAVVGKESRLRNALEDVECEYLAVFDIHDNDHFDAAEFVASVQNVLNGTRVSWQTANLREIDRAIHRLKKDVIERANRIFAIDYADYIDTQGFDISYHLREMNSGLSRELATSVRAAFDTQMVLNESRKDHEEAIKRYNTKQENIDRCFSGKGLPVHHPWCRAMSNRTMLAMQQIIANVSYSI